LQVLNKVMSAKQIGKGVFVLLAVAVLAAGCVSLPKPLYFTLDMSPAQSNKASHVLKPDRAIIVDAIHVTDKLVRRDVLIQEDPTEYEYYHDAKWIERVPDLVAEKLEVEFSRPDQNLSENPGLRVFVLYGTLLAFEQVDGKDGTAYAHIKLDAQIRRQGTGRQTVLFEHTYEYYEPVDAPSPLPKMVVDKLSEGMEQIAVEIAKDVNGLTL